MCGPRDYHVFQKCPVWSFGLATPAVSTNFEKIEDSCSLDEDDLIEFMTVYDRDGEALARGTIFWARHRSKRSTAIDSSIKESSVTAIRDISRSCLDPNDFTVLNCIVKGHASLSPPSFWLHLCSRFTLLAT
ncbi:hypothetical protein TNCV_1831831 [Trichonephila clavipes]|nr:hypothetical protein TNCV_1831831 [Trichonephila clavipes]